MRSRTPARYACALTRRVRRGTRANQEEQRNHAQMEGQEQYQKADREQLISSGKVKDRPISFRFLSLPPEIRNKIYDLLLNNRHKFRVPSSDWVSADSGLDRGIPSARNSISPGIVLASKQTYSEASSMLYANKLYVATGRALLKLLQTVGPRNRPLIRQIEIWNSCRELDYSKKLTWQLLSQCQNLECLRFGKSTRLITDKIAARLASRVLDDGWIFFQALGAARGLKDAAVDVLRFDLDFICLKFYIRYRHPVLIGGTHGEVNEWFDGEVKAALRTKLLTD